MNRLLLSSALICTLIGFASASHGKIHDVTGMVLAPSFNVTLSCGSGIGTVAFDSNPTHTVAIAHFASTNGRRTDDVANTFYWTLSFSSSPRSFAIGTENPDVSIHLEDAAGEWLTGSAEFGSCNSAASTVSFGDTLTPSTAKLSIAPLNGDCGGSPFYVTSLGVDFVGSLYASVNFGSEERLVLLQPPLADGKLDRSEIQYFSSSIHGAGVSANYELPGVSVSVGNCRNQ